MGYFNFKTDSFFIAGGLPPGIDSAMAKTLTKIMATMLGEYIYVFGKNGKFELENAMEENETGNYTTDPNMDTITTIVKRNNLMVTEKMLYKIKNRQLHLTMIGWEDRVEFVMERLREQ